LNVKNNFESNWVIFHFFLPLTDEIKNEGKKKEVILEGVIFYEEKLNEKGRKNCQIAIFATRMIKNLFFMFGL
jgi:hypothetical protein